MISFIVIGRNEGWKLPKSIQSIKDTIIVNKLLNVEIIYVDSNSTDNSINSIKKFEGVKIFKLTEDCNAAIARNVGAKEAKGDVLFFADGDMEINKNVFLELFDKSGELKYEFISGDFQNIYYENNDSKEVLGTEMYHKINKEKKNFTTGGLFALSKKSWESIGGMREVFKRSQDMDLGLRLSKNKIFLHRLPINLAKHHTVSYRNDNRLWNDLKDKTHLYARSLLYRKNLWNINIYKLMISQDYSFVVLVISLLLSLVFRNAMFLLLYVLILMLRSYPRKNINYMFYFLWRDFKVLFGFFFFFPPKNKVAYKLIN